MKKLLAEIARLYQPEPAQALPDAPDAADLLAPDGGVRTLVLELGRPADWALLGTVWRGVQTDLDLCAPAIAVNAVDGYQLWFSLVQPVDAAQAQAFLHGLCQRYLGGVAPKRLHCFPQPSPAPGEGLASVHPAPRLPALQAVDGRWSAFLAPDLAAVFADEPWLDRAPGDEAQAQLLARLHSMPLAAFHGALQQLQPAPAVPTQSAAEADVALTGAPPTGQSPQDFLRAVMNDPGVALALRIQAAAALLPYGKD